MYLVCDTVRQSLDDTLAAFDAWPVTRFHSIDIVSPGEGLLRVSVHRRYLPSCFPSVLISTLPWSLDIGSLTGGLGYVKIPIVPAHTP